jgi:hypothetical protein
MLHPAGEVEGELCKFEVALVSKQDDPELIPHSSSLRTLVLSV